MVVVIIVYLPFITMSVIVVVVVPPTITIMPISIVFIITIFPASLISVPVDDAILVLTGVHALIRASLWHCNDNHVS